MSNWELDDGVGPHWPFRKFVAGADWVKIGPLVTSPDDEIIYHRDLDERVLDPRETVTQGWLRINGLLVDVDVTVGTLSHAARTQLQEWADENDLELTWPERSTNQG